MKDLLEEVAAYAAAHQLWQRGDHLVVACSGGADSLSLLDILARLARRDKLQLTACYVHHGIRKAADQEIALVRQEAIKRRCGFACQYVNVPQLAANEHRSLEAIGHRERYRILYETARACGASAIAVAHHADDQAETVLLHLLRGSGLDGLSGMRPRRGGVIRPLLGVTKAQLTAYAKAHQLPYCEDETNKDTAYRRNRIRWELLPLLKTYNPAITADLNRLAAILAAEDDYLSACSKKEYAKFVCQKGKGAAVKKKVFLSLPLALQRRLLRGMWQQVTGSLRDLPFHYIETMRALMKKGAGKEFRSGPARAYTTHELFCLEPAGLAPRHRL